MKQPARTLTRAQRRRRTLLVRAAVWVVLICFVLSTVGAALIFLAPHATR